MGVAWWNLQSQLLVAIQKDDAARAKQLLVDGVDVDARFIVSGGRRPALCLCVERDSLDLGITLLILIRNLQFMMKASCVILNCSATVSGFWVFGEPVRHAGSDDSIASCRLKRKCPTVEHFAKK